MQKMQVYFDMHIRAPLLLHWFAGDSCLKKGNFYDVLLKGRTKIGEILQITAYIGLLLFPKITEIATPLNWILL